MSRKGLKGAAQKVMLTGCVNGHWYENRRSIDVYVQPMGSTQIAHCRIRRSLLEDWLKRTAKP